MNEAVPKSSQSSGAAPRAVEFTGILPSQWIKDMVSSGGIVGSLLHPIEIDQVQPASIDLRLGDYAYPVRTSFLPGKDLRVLDKLRRLDPEVDSVKIDLRDGAALNKDRIYVIPLLETVNLRSGEITAFS